MGILKKMKFWNKKDELDFDDLATKEINKPTAKDPFQGAEENVSGMDEKFFADESEESAFTPKSQSLGLTKPSSLPNLVSRGIGGSSGGDLAKDLELISSKLDTLKAVLTSMDQRLANLEKAAGVEQRQRLW